MAPPADLPQGHPDNIERPELLPDPSLSRADGESSARAGGDGDVRRRPRIDPAVVAIDEPADLTDGLPDARQETLPGTHPNTGDPDAPVVVGIDQAFLTPDDGEDRAVSAAVAIRDGVVIEYARAITPLSIPYIPASSRSGKANRYWPRSTPRRRAGSAGL